MQNKVRICATTSPPTMQRPIGCREDPSAPKPNAMGSAPKIAANVVIENRAHTLDGGFEGGCFDAEALSSAHDRKVDQHDAVFLDQTEEQKESDESIEIERHAKKLQRLPVLRGWPREASKAR